jgi:hypothetical protein
MTLMILPFNIPRKVSIGRCYVDLIREDVPEI